MAKAATRKGGRKKPARKSATAASGMGRWYLAGVMVIGAVVAYDHRGDILPLAGQVKTASIPKAEPVRKQVAENRVTDAPRKSALAMPTPDIRPSSQGPVPPAEIKTASLTPMPTPGPAPAAPRTGAYYFCTQTLENCVVDGSTFWYGRRKVEIADIRVPRIKQAECDNERKIGSLAKRRLWELLNVHGANVAASGDAAVVRVGSGDSVADILISEGLAKPRSASGEGWCGAG